MPRPPRLDLPGITQHVIQRGNDRQPCFLAAIDHVRYLQDLREITLHEGCAIHAHVLMSNHVHLLITPSSPGGVGRAMQALGRRYVRYFNDRYGRTGTLWEGRYKACVVADEPYLLQCHRYIELNPVRANMVADPADYRWSSHRHHALGAHDPMITPHPVLANFGSTPEVQRRNYRAWVMQPVDANETSAIRRHIQRQRVLGSDGFVRGLEAQLGMRFGPKKIGRPRKGSNETTDLPETGKTRL